MKLSENAIYPYPIWGWTTDFLGPEPQADISMEKDALQDEFRFVLTLANPNPGIEQLIQEGYAEYSLTVSCSKTFFSKTNRSKELPILLQVPANEVVDELLCQGFIVATKEIRGCTCLDIIDDYERIVDFPKGAVIGMLVEKRIFLSGVDSLIDLDKIISIMPDPDEAGIKTYLGTDKIQVMMAPEKVEQFQELGRAYPQIANALITRDALIEGLIKLNDPGNGSWTDYLTAILNMFPEIEVPEDSGLTYDDAVKVTDEILRNPKLDALSISSRLINSENDEA